MFQNLGWPEIAVLLLLGLFIFGPDKLPKMISDGVQMLRQLRRMAQNATADLSRELGTNIELEDLHPKTFVRKHLLSEEDEQLLRKPLENLYQGVRSDLTQVGADLKDVRDAVDPKIPAPAAAPAVESRPSAAPATAAPAHRYDNDAT